MTEIKPDEPINKLNIFWLTITSLTILILFLQLQFDHSNFKASFLSILTLGIPFMLMIFQYRQLRKNKVFVAWIGIGILLSLGFLWLRTDPTLLLKSNKSAALGLKCPLAFLVAYFIFRKISLKYYGTELIIPPKYGRHDTAEGRDSNFMDNVSMFSYWIIILVTNVK